MFVHLPATTSVDVIPACDRSGMYHVLKGIELRYALTIYLMDHGHASINEMIEDLRARNFSVRGRASKAVSDALRWEIERGRVRRLGRGLYGPAGMPRSTEYRIRDRVLDLRAAAKLSREGGQTPCRLPETRMLQM
jgi:hypothetical protein